MLHELRALRSDAAARASKQQLVLFGRTLVQEYAERGGRWQHLFAAKECQLQLSQPSQQQQAQTQQSLSNPAAVLLGAEEIKLASGMESVAAADACACVIPLPKLQPPVAATTKRLLVLDEVKDPGNLGTLIRSALAFDFSLLLVGPGGCDVFSDKVIRSSMGACLDAPIYACDEATLVRLLEEHRRAQPHLRVFVSDVAAAGCVPLSQVRASADEAVWFVLGNEARGVRPSLLSLGTARVHIPMSPRVESLNVAVAGSILMQHVHSSSSSSSS